MWTARAYPGGIDVVRTKAKAAFREVDGTSDAAALRRALARGEYMLREMQALISLHKYRALKKRYYIDLDEDVRSRMRELESQAVAIDSTPESASRTSNNNTASQQ